MPPQKVKAYLESVKNDVKQKRIPNEGGGTEKMDSVVNPMSMVEDYYFAQTANGRGSRVETLSGGESLGEIADLNYFQNKFFKGLRIPSSYMRGQNDQGSQIQDGKVGLAYFEEQKFANFVKRLQNKMSPVFDAHFKRFLLSIGLKIDNNLFKIELPEPQNFQKYKQAAIDSDMLNNFGNVKDVAFISNRMKLKNYLGWSEDDIQANESMLRQELNIPEGGLSPELTDIRMMYDPAWLENKPEIKAPEDLYKITLEGEEPPPEETPPEEGGDTPPEETPPEEEPAAGGGEEDITPAKEEPAAAEKPPKEPK